MRRAEQAARPDGGQELPPNTEAAVCPPRLSGTTFGGMSRQLAASWLLLWSVATSSAAQAPLSEHDVLILAKSAEGGDRNTIRDLFALYARSDGAATEDIDTILGNVARRHPRTFLEELKSSDAGHGKCTNVGNTLDLVDELDKQLAELRARRRALRSVSSASLNSLRDDCIRKLDKDIQGLVNARAQMKNEPAEHHHPADER